MMTLTVKTVGNAISTGNDYYVNLKYTRITNLTSLK